MILVSQPDFGPAESAAAQAVIESQWVGMGPQNEKFETALANCLGVRHVVATNSCTAALHLVMALPLHTQLSPVQIERIAAEVSRFLKHAGPARKPQPRIVLATA